jgi:hypothetical protein
MSNSIIRAELETRLKAWADAQVPKVPIAFEGVSFTKPNDGVFLEAFLIPSITLDTAVDGSRQRLLGMFQVNCWARSGKGMRQVEALAQSIINLFPLLPKTGAVSIEKTPNAESHILDSAGWIIVPVTISYRFET